LTILSGVSY